MFRRPRVIRIRCVSRRKNTRNPLKNRKLSKRKAPKRKLSKRKTPKRKSSKRKRGGFVRDGSVQQFVRDYCL